MSLFPSLLRTIRPSSWMEHNLKMIRQMEALFSQPFPEMHPSMRIEWKDPWYVIEKNASKTPFTVRLDVKSFAPKEITVKTVDDNIIVEGKHEEKSEDGGVITKHFVKTFNLPIGHEPEDVVSTLTKEGILTITAPTKEVPESINERKVPIAIQDEEVKEKQKN